MFQTLLNYFFGCAHRRTTFPLTPTRRPTTSFGAPATPRHTTYVVCLDCGKEFGYNWEEMRVGEPVSDQAPAAVMA
jgi:hypothetical protein